MTLTPVDASEQAAQAYFQPPSSGRLWIDTTTAVTTGGQDSMDDAHELRVRAGHALLPAGSNRTAEVSLQWDEPPRPVAYNVSILR